MKRLILIFLIFGFLCMPAFAEDDSDKSILGKTLDETLSPLEILLKPSQRLEPIVVTPTRYEDPLLSVSKNVTVITEEEIRESRARYVPDVLREKTGIIVSDFLGNGKTVRIDSRGFGDSASSNMLVLVNGRRTNQIDLSGADWSQISPEAIEKIEVVRGPQTVLYGDNAVSGVINIITKSGRDKKPEVGFKYETGSYRYNSYKGHVQGGSDFLDYFGMISTSYNNGYRINNHLETVDYNARLTLKPSDYLKFSIDGGYHKDWYGQPGAVKPVDINQIGRRGSIYPQSRAKTEDYYLMATPEIKHNFGFVDFLFSGDIITRNRHTHSLTVYSFGNYLNTHHIKTFGVTPKLAFSADLFGIENRLLAGVDYYANTDEINGGPESGPDLTVIHKDSLGFYMTDTLELPLNLVLNGGIRSEWAKYKFDQQEKVAVGERKTPFEYAYDIGLSFKYNKNSSLYATYSRFFRFPVTDEWYQAAYYWGGAIQGGINSELKPQVGYHYEIGIKENSSKYVGLQADYYIMDIKHELYYNPLTYRNAVYHHTIHHGLELEINGYFFDSLKPFASYTYQKAFFVGDDFAGNEIPLVPRHKFSAGLEYTFMDSVFIKYTANYVGERRFINDLKNDQPKLKLYTTHDIKMSYRKYGLEIFASLNNILDEEYSEYGVLDFTLTTPGYYPSPRRNFSIGVSYKF